MGEFVEDGKRERTCLLVASVPNVKAIMAVHTERYRRYANCHLPIYIWGSLSIDKLYN